MTKKELEQENKELREKIKKLVVFEEKVKIAMIEYQGFTSLLKLLGKQH